MATQVSLSIRRAAAMEQITAAASALKERWGLTHDVTEVRHRDADVERVLQLEELARFMAELAEKSPAPIQPTAQSTGRKKP